jgi:membrane protein DedA with SNARE-associated domain
MIGQPVRKSPLPPSVGTPNVLTRRRLLIAIAAILAFGTLVIILLMLAGGDGFGLLDGTEGNWAYLTIFAFIFGDAICALLPGETTLNTAATLAANGTLELELVMLAGALGAFAGDSAVYWIMRTWGKRLQEKLENAKENDTVASALEFLGSSAPLLLVAGRYVPGVRTVVSATLGLSRYSYRTFAFWSAIGGTLWSVYTCSLAYLVASALVGFPLASIVISGTVTTVALVMIFVVARRRRAKDHVRGEPR